MSFYSPLTKDSINGALDVPLTEETIRMCDWSFGAFDSSVWNLGTGGEARMHWVRVGRMVHGWITINIASDATAPSGFFIVPHPDDLPYPPKADSGFGSGYPMAGGFGVLYKANTAGSPPPYNGYRYGLAPIVQNIAGTVVMVFFRTQSEGAIPSAADNTWSPVSSTPVAGSAVPGANFNAHFVYEADDAA